MTQFKYYKRLSLMFNRYFLYRRAVGSRRVKFLEENFTNRHGQRVSIWVEANHRPSNMVAITKEAAKDLFPGVKHKII